jgi:hypothetical protein
VVLARPEEGDGFALEQDGERLPIALRRGGFQQDRPTWELVGGRSLVLSAPSGACDLVLYRGGVEVRRRPATIVAGELVTLQP